MGVSGSGKSTVGAALAGRLGYRFVEGDELHSRHDIAQMASGHPLTDAQRLPWLRAVGERLAVEAVPRSGVVAACSALRRAYRDVLRSYAPDAFFVELDAPEATIRARMLERRDSFMPPSLLGSQYATLEPLDDDEAGVRLDAEHSASVVVDEVLRVLDRGIDA
jgi:carbohydrate kinase (thermoresistant glucokinase family)